MNFEVSPKSFEKYLSYEDAKLYVFALGDGWRFPSVKEYELCLIHHDFESGLHYTDSDRLVAFGWRSFKHIERTSFYDTCFIRPFRDLKDN